MSKKKKKHDILFQDEISKALVQGKSVYMRKNGDLKSAQVCDLSEMETNLIRWFVKEGCEAMSQKDMNEEMIWWIAKAWENVSSEERKQYIEEFNNLKKEQ